nr:enoyl-CoA hydratase-related protein [Brevibacterium permense]
MRNRVVAATNSQTVAIDGYCIGGAAEIAAAADFRIGGSDSWYSVPEVRIGIPSVLESVNLHRLMGWTKVTEFVLTGNRFTAEDMLQCGFLNDIVAEAAIPVPWLPARGGEGPRSKSALALLRDTTQCQPRRHRSAEATDADVEEHLRSRGDRRQSEEIRARLRREGRETVA